MTKSELRKRMQGHAADDTAGVLAAYDFVASLGRKLDKSDVDSFDGKASYGGNPIVSLAISYLEAYDDAVAEGKRSRFVYLDQMSDLALGYHRGRRFGNAQAKGVLNCLRADIVRRGF